jgi:penicillin-binding protein 2
MSAKQNLEKTFTRRALLVGTTQLCLLGVLGTRLTWLQVAQGSRYQTLANKNRINIKMLAPSRGLIVDRYGIPLAINDQNFRILIIPEQTKDIETSLSKLQKLIPLSQRDIKRVLKESNKKASFVPIEVKDNLNWDEVAKIEVNLPELPGISIDEGEKRSYPLGPATAHLVGYVSSVSKGDLSEKDPVLKLPGFKVGKTGIEKSLDKDLRGKAGAAEVEVNVAGRPIRELSKNPGIQGKKVKLTIDAELQKSIQKRLSSEKSASAVVMDTQTGALYAIASVPSFEPNQFTTGLSAEAWEELLADPGHPLNNKAIGGQYPPGSTFKMITALAALEAGVVNYKTSVYCTGHYEYGGDKFHCWKKSGHGTVDLVKALEQSCDTYFYKLATDLGIDRIATMARKFGLGEKLKFELSEERPGLIPDKKWKMGYFGNSWKPGETVVASIGQGYIQSTPVQLATMTARLVNGGYAVKPWLVGYVDQNPGLDTSWPKINVKKWHLDLIKRGMNFAVNKEKGTAFKARITDSAMKMGGKTGTAQVRRITMEERLEGIENKDLPWNLRHHALFVGYAPLNKPRYACAVIVEHGGSGSSSAAPIAKDILLMTQKRAPAEHKLLPDGVISNKMIIPPHKPKKRILKRS